MLQYLTPALALKSSAEVMSTKLSFFRNDKVHNITAKKYIVGADGIAQLLGDSCIRTKKFAKHVSIQQWFAETHVNPFYSCIFDPDITDCYS